MDGMELDGSIAGASTVASTRSFVSVLTGNTGEAVQVTAAHVQPRKKPGPKPKQSKALDDTTMEDDDSKKKRARSEKRKLETIPWTGLGYDRRKDNNLWVLGQFQMLQSFPRVWWMRDHICGRGTQNAMLNGPFNQIEVLNWMTTPRIQVSASHSPVLCIEPSCHAHFTSLSISLPCALTCAGALC